jgi:hypothetical protein
VGISVIVGFCPMSRNEFSYRVRPQWITIGENGTRRITHETLIQWIQSNAEDLLIRDHFYPWLLLLSVLPPEIDQWQTHFENLVNSYLELAKCKSDWPTKRFPRNTTIDSFGTEHLIGSIYIDVIRSGRIIHWLPPVGSLADPSSTDPFFETHEHFRRIERLLFVFANEANGQYSQGFNELAAVLYAVIVKGFWTDHSYESFMDGCASLDQVEAMSYCCFKNLIHWCGLLRVYNSDDQSVITEYLSDFESLAEKRLPTVMTVLKHHEITPIFYALRWFTLLFSQEYELASLLWIWDELFIHVDHFMEFLPHMGIAHLEAISQHVSMDDYMRTLDIVQHGKAQSVRIVRQRANASWEITCPPDSPEAEPEIEPFDESDESTPPGWFQRAFTAMAQTVSPPN